MPLFLILFVDIKLVLFLCVQTDKGTYIVGLLDLRLRLNMLTCTSTKIIQD